MQYIIEDVGNVSVVRFDGDLGGTDEGSLKKMFVRLRQDEKGKVVADMTKVGFMDSTIIGVLVWGMKNQREADGDFRLFGLTPAVNRVFDITQLNRAFQIFSAEGEALASFG